MAVHELANIGVMAAENGLAVMGGFNADHDASLPRGAQSLVLLGPDGPGFWEHFCAQPEGDDGLPDPIDRWSRRVIGGMAGALQGEALFPFGQTPALPFISWALKSGQAFVSDAHLLIHSQAGLWVSYRGAIALPHKLDFAPQARNPCTTCADKPCLSACPVCALDKSGYTISACHDFLETDAGQDCMSSGCAVRRACPVSQGYGRTAPQSAHHMRYFHK